VAERKPQTDAAAASFRPRNLFRHEAQGTVAVFTNEQCGRMVVPCQRPKAVEYLIEQVLRKDLLHQLSIDTIAHLEEAVTIDLLDRIRQHEGDPDEQPCIVAVECRLMPRDRESAPRRAAAPEWPDQHTRA